MGRRLLRKNSEAVFGELELMGKAERMKHVEEIPEELKLMRVFMRTWRTKGIQRNVVLECYLVEEVCGVPEAWNEDIKVRNLGQVDDQARFPSPANE